MTVKELISNYSPVGDMISVMTCMILMFVISKVLYYSKDKKFNFLIRSLVFILLGSGSNIVFWSLITNFDCESKALFLVRYMYHISFMCCLYCFMLYMKYMLDVKGRMVTFGKYLTRTMFVLCIVLDLFSPVTKAGFHCIDGMWYDPIVSAYNFFYVYSMLILFIMLAFYSRRIIRYVRICLIFSQTIIVFVMGCQFVRNSNTFSSFTYLMPVLVVMILLHSRPFDDKTGSLSASSFDSFVKQANENNISVDYLVLKLYLSMVDRMPDELGKALNSFWHSSFKDATLFDLDNDLYVLAIPRIAKNGNVEEKSEKLISEHFHEYYDQYRFPFKIIKLPDVNFIQGVDDILGILKYLLQITEENSVFTVDGKVKEQLMQYKIISDNLAQIDASGDLNDPRVLTYCQPIRNMKTGKYDTGEALMRLYLPETGLVMPSMFIEIAEQYEHIHALSRIMLNKVCRQIKELEDEGYDFKRISVNFAISEIKSDGFCDEILEIIHNNGVNPSKIGIELTESQTEKDFPIIKRKMEKLRNRGITLYLDDVGTGYSNLDRIVQYDVDVVKFDRFFLLEAEKENSYRIVKMMKHLSKAFRDLDYQLLYEGVENENHEELCLDCGADYIQGFKYSKPVPIEEMRNYFEKNTEGSDEV